MRLRDCYNFHDFRKLAKRCLPDPRLFSGLCAKARAWSGDRIPFLPSSLPRPAKIPRQSELRDGRPQLVYFPSRASRLMAPGVDDAERASLPERPGGLCCGMPIESKGHFQVADDKATPELNGSAPRHLRVELPADCRAGISTSRTCEIGLSHHSGLPYHSLAYLVEHCSR